MENDSSTAATIAVKIITDIASKAATKLSYFITKKYKVVTAGKQISLGLAYQEYLNYAENKYAKMKTLLYRHEPKYLYSFLEPLNVTNGTDVLDTSNVHDFMQKGRCILLTGSGGTGKSVMMKHLFLDCIKRSLFIPVLIELRSFNGKKFDDSLFIDYVYDNLCALNFKIEKEYFIDSLISDLYLFLFDGFDELGSDLVKAVSETIQSFCAKYSSNHFIISSRPSIEFIGWHMFAEYQMMPMKKEQALSLINRLEYDTITKQNFYASLRDKLFDKYESFASIPLLLTIMLITYDYSGYIPENINNFYEQAFFALYYTHDSTKDGYKRIAHSGLCYEEFKCIFSYFCFKTYFADTFEFTSSQVIEYIKSAKEKFEEQISFECLDFLFDLTHYVCMLVSEGLNFKFAHRSFQEYFAAVYTVQLPDEILVNFFCGHISKGLRSSEIYEMLYQMHQSRFIKNVIYPGLCKLRDFINSCGQSTYSIMKSILDNIVLYKGTKKGTIINIRSSYITEFLRMACELLDFQSTEYSPKQKVKTDKCMQRIKTKFRKKLDNDKPLFLSFEEIERAGCCNELYENMIYYREGLDFLMSYLNNYESTLINLKTDFETLAASL